MLSGALRTVKTHLCEIKVLIAHFAIISLAGEWGFASRSRASGWLIERSLENAGGFLLNNNDESPNRQCVLRQRRMERRKYTHAESKGDG